MITNIDITIWFKQYLFHKYKYIQTKNTHRYKVHGKIYTLTMCKGDFNRTEETACSLCYASLLYIIYGCSNRILHFLVSILGNFKNVIYRNIRLFNPNG